MDAADRLTTIMMELGTEHEQLLRLGELKKAALVRNDIQRLQQLVEEEQEHVRRLEHLELRRQLAVQQLLGVPSNSASLQDVLAVVPQPAKEKLAQLGDRLRSLLTELQGLNEQNRLLVQQGLEFVRASMELFAAAELSTPVYNREAKMDEPPAGVSLSWLDRKV